MSFVLCPLLNNAKYAIYGSLTVTRTVLLLRGARALRPCDSVRGHDADPVEPSCAMTGDVAIVPGASEV